MVTNFTVFSIKIINNHYKTSIYSCRFQNYSTAKLLYVDFLGIISSYICSVQTMSFSSCFRKACYRLGNVRDEFIFADNPKNYDC